MSGDDRRAISMTTKQIQSAGEDGTQLKAEKKKKISNYTLS